MSLGKQTLTEMISRFEMWGPKRLSEYLENKPVLILLPLGENSRAITWTPYASDSDICISSTPHSGSDVRELTDSTETVLLDKNEQLLPAFPEGSEVVPIMPGERKAFIIGRAYSNQLTIQDKSMSRTHAEIYETERGWYIKDLGSQNGTYVENHRLKQFQAIPLKSMQELGFSSKPNSTPRIISFFVTCEDLIRILKGEIFNNFVSNQFPQFMLNDEV